MNAIPRRCLFTIQWENGLRPYIAFPAMLNILKNVLAEAMQGMSKVVIIGAGGVGNGCAKVRTACGCFY